MDRERVALFEQHLAEVAEARGIELTPELANAVFAESARNGLTADSTVAALNGLEFEEITEDEDGLDPGIEKMAFDFNMDLGQLQAKIGRKLTDREKQAVAEDAFEQAARHGSIDLGAAAGRAGVKSYADMTPAEANRAMTERARDLNPDPRDDPDRVFDMENRRDVNDWMARQVMGTAPLAGQEGDEDG